ncbi:S1 RNA-binding domain-containing protein [Actinomadura kijaniata]|uniref:S1 RNA-binding domain-containing protein n=1 Tax=Actinomadura kijaniata TaxID=46161 RepID=UPI003F1CF1D2
MDEPRVGEVRTGTVTEITRSHVSVAVDGMPGTVSRLEGSWRRPWGAVVEELAVGRRIAVGVTAVEPDLRLSLAAAEDPGLHAFLGSLRPGRRLSGRVAAIERFGVFVDLDEGPGHPAYPGVGFVTVPELSWRHFDDPADVVTVGDRVTGEFLQFDTWNGEARLSLRALLPDPLKAFAREHEVGRVLRGVVTKVVPFGVFVRVADGVEGLLPSADGCVGDRVAVVLRDVDLGRRRVLFSPGPTL